MMKTMEAMSPVDIVITIGKLKPPPVDYDAQYNMTIIPNEILDSLWKKIDVWMKTEAADDAKEVAVEATRLAVVRNTGNI